MLIGQIRYKVYSLYLQGVTGDLKTAHNGEAVELDARLQ